MRAKYDFSGWATKNDLKCSDGRTIRKNAFAEQDGQTVPLVWQHMHNDPLNVLGHALLENRDEGVYAYCTFNDTEGGKNAKILVEHGDVSALSIYANKLKQTGGNVMHGVIREVSLVLAGANPGALIDFPSLAHGEEDSSEAVIYTGEDIFLAHSEDFEEENEEQEEPEEEKEEAPEEVKEEEPLEHADKEGDEMADSEKTVQDVFDELNEEQKNVVYFMIGQALEDAGVDVEDEGEEEDMKHNVFDNEYDRSDVLTHADQGDILNLAKQPGMTFQSALSAFAEQNGMEGELMHDAVSVSGFYQTPPTLGALTVDALFPEYKDVRPGAPELITNDQGWIGTVLSKVHKSPISRIRTGQVDIRKIDDLRARGYQKGNKKSITGNFQLVRRTTDPQTIYVKSQLHRDDIIDITDFDYVQYLYNIDRMNLNEELATAIMVGDGRSDESADKIFPEHIRPIWTDDELFTMHHDLDVEAMKETLQGEETGSFFGQNFILAEAFIEKVLYAREKFKGTGTPDCYMDPHMLNVMLLARDRNGHRIFSSKAELASALNVNSIVTAEQFADLAPRKDGSNNYHKLLALIVNLADYSLGSTKGGEITHFTDFDIDFNLQKSLLETRCSGALTRVYSAIAIEQPAEAPSGN
jgi:HK97 family phage prohead protease